MTDEILKKFCKGDYTFHQNKDLTCSIFLHSKFIHRSIQFDSEEDLRQYAREYIKDHEIHHAII